MAPLKKTYTPGRVLPEAAAEMSEAADSLAAAFFALHEAQSLYAGVASSLERLTHVMAARQEQLARSQQRLGGR